MKTKCTILSLIDLPCRAGLLLIAKVAKRSTRGTAVDAVPLVPYYIYFAMSFAAAAYLSAVAFASSKVSPVAII